MSEGGGLGAHPRLVTSLVALVSVALLAVAIRYGWFGPDIGRGATFCEASREGWLKQPANTISNGGFVLAGLLVAQHVSRSRVRGAVMSRALAVTYACVLVLLGPASAAMHATQSACGGHLDMLSMYLIAGFAAAYAVTRWLRRGPGTFAALYVVLVVACQLVGLWPHQVPVVRFSGNAAFAVLLIVALVLEALLWRRGETDRTAAYGLLALGSILVAFVIWVMDQHGWCDPWSWLQGHAVWHLLCAVAGYFLYRLYASERIRSAAAAAPRRRTP